MVGMDHMVAKTLKYQNATIRHTVKSTVASSNNDKFANIIALLMYIA